ncbi:class I SAM-dependent methyltransferase [Acidaminobacter sp. JC074]|uniref:methyltransferase domain-containing protein n=1 Tax=Acidaminobacter sp. JC074 TaxID=2530199 RepID=UPI001F0F0BC9|nr:methyltransferase domain-containing protein [Acidaminobacter sp. JC074]MCH4886076.1 class I SAM-dependent methyltransferase [Acidaminobacter sp. JC074]
MNKCQEWYNKIAIRNKGYKSHANYIKEGISGEDIFEERLIELLPNYSNVLDIGCGHGEFTLSMSKYAQKITGGDSALELIKIAKALKEQNQVDNVDFIYFHTHEIDEKHPVYDLIYNRRGPTSIYDHKELLEEGGRLLAIHPLFAMEKVITRLKEGGFMDIQVDVFDECLLVFDSKSDFAEHLSSMHMSLDNTLDEHREALEKLIQEHTLDGRLVLKEERFIVSAC